ncbi:MAG TPA: tRNA (guanine(26)-N(2))-dimethyltransferase [Candidatus Nanoarchaeia archaeon]|nr:tRNA (guanine(26)-N(2))-dimethyltransferase [Candidatus Nanoarchaeia archaeon]
MYKLMQEGMAKLKVPVVKIVSKQMPVFYNPVMKFNRDVTVLLLNTIDKWNMNIADPLAGSGVRSVRLLLELKTGKISSLGVNDHSSNACSKIKESLKLNKVKSKNATVSNCDANLFLLNSNGFDFIDVDPFGTPNPFLDCAVKRISREGILAVTATDTSALSGTYPKSCLRKYWAKPVRSELMHEIGLRILIRKVQLIGVQYDKALFPIFSFSKDHYMRVFFRCDKSKEETDNVLRQHGLFLDAGPMWLGKLWDEKLADKMAKENTVNENAKILRIIAEESLIDTVGFYDLHKIAKKEKIEIPRKLELLEKLRKKGYLASETHFSGTGIRSDIRIGELLDLLIITIQ